MMRNSQKNYEAWMINEKDFPLKGPLEEKIRFLTGYGILAPSTHNSQPWLLKIEANKLIIKPDFTKELKVGDPNRWGLYISIGAFAENISHAASYYDIQTSTKIYRGSITISFDEDTKSHFNKKTNITNIVNRHSNKFEYKPNVIHKKTIQLLEKISTKNVRVDVICDKIRLEQI